MPEHSLPRILRSLILVLGVAISACGTGCAFRSGAAEDRAMLPELSLPAPEAWPARETSWLGDMVSVTPDRLRFAFPMSIVVDSRLTTVTWSESVRVVENGAFGRGIVRRITPAPNAEEARAADRALRDRELNGLQFVSFPADAGALRVASSARADEDPSRYRRYLLRRMSIRTGADGVSYLTRPGTRMRVFEPSSHVALRGVVIHLSSLAGFDYEHPVIEQMNAAGWMVLQIDASTVRRRDEPIRLSPSDDFTRAAARLGRVIDNRVAEIAYAAEAGLAYVEKIRPQAADLPVVIAGYSAGALVGPSVAALLHERVDAVVLVGGGANLLNISRRSTLTNGGIRVQWRDGEPDETTWKRLEDAYLEATELDPYKTAPCLTHKPVLVLHGIFDDIIPADAGDLLYQRLGRPERVVFTLGHRGLFWRLPAQSRLITDWVNANTRGIVKNRQDVVHSGR